MCVLHKCLCSAQALHSSPVSPVKKTRRRNPTPRSELHARATAASQWDYYKATEKSTYNPTFTYKSPDNVERPQA
ncbi:hypothetical protein VZT92_003620 [Zoarces viviparus]|uniref:Uncharacterized protein n=1 Tax=Zoarces viviparus TaxID=48416 RepID=A0AAW1FWE1_ZOAVI